MRHMRQEVGPSTSRRATCREQPASSVAIAQGGADEGGANTAADGEEGGDHAATASESRPRRIGSTVSLFSAIHGLRVAAPPPGAPSFSYLVVFSNCPLVAAVLTFSIAQSIKVLTTWYKENRWDAKQLVGSGGMPSSHSATITALAVAVGL
uniref:Acid phosphatase/vanadium-dependent haloperoxidase-related protein n=1 Tax=Zea mays TaxID=4577 RepID=A0A804N7U8_MAIZE